MSSTLWHALGSIRVGIATAGVLGWTPRLADGVERCQIREVVARATGSRAGAERHRVGGGVRVVCGRRTSLVAVNALPTGPAKRDDRRRSERRVCVALDARDRSVAGRRRPVRGPQGGAVALGALDPARGHYSIWADRLNSRGERLGRVSGLVVVVGVGRGVCVRADVDAVVAANAVAVLRPVPDA